ncbi:MAG: CRISPR-associated endonuclease Cas3'' [Bacteroidales bacterium]|nr:CRISPR-associated endonuclease Cas3'' [Bacteroidales bacterium]
MDDINSYKSHSDKSLIKHTQGVIQNLVEITDSPLAKIAAIFHDVGKLNPNFQKKFDNTIPKTGNYSNHSTISAYAFWCFINQNYQKFSDQFNLRLSKNDVLSILVLIAKHHGNLPDFIPGKNKSSDYIFDEKDFKDALTLISKTKLPIYEFVSKFGEFS